jgi:type II secretory pathway component PulM
MGWVIIVVIAYLPIVYRIHKRLDYLEQEVKRLKGQDTIVKK